MIARINECLVLVACTSAISVLCSCATSTATVTNRADSSAQTSIQKISITEAIRRLNSRVATSICTSDNTFTCSEYRSPSVKRTIRNLVVDGKYNYDLATLKLTLTVTSWPGNAVFLTFNDGMALLENQNSDTTYAKWISDAILTLKDVAILNNEEIGPNSTSTFERTAMEYRTASTKPTIPENARMYKVQAEDAIRNKEFDEAAYRFCQALKIAPWWPEAHFNRALVLEQLNEFDLAVSEMKRYLELVPGAPDAKAAQDQIYKWQRRVVLNQ